MLDPIITPEVCERLNNERNAKREDRDVPVRRPSNDEMMLAMGFTSFGGKKRKPRHSSEFSGKRQAVLTPT